MDKMWFKARRLVSMLLVLAMLASAMPVQAFAEETAEPADVSTMSETVTEEESAAAEAEAAAKAAEEEAAAKAAEEEAARKAAEEAAAQKAAEEAAAQKAAEEAAAQKAAEEAAAQKAAEEAAAQKAAEEAAAQKAAEEAAAQKAAEEADGEQTELTDPAAETEKPVEENVSEEETPAEEAPAEEAAQPVEGEAQQEPDEEEPVLVSYTVRYLDKATEASVEKDTTGEAAVGETIAIEAPAVEGYTLCADQPTELVLAADTENTMTLYYEETMPAQTLSATASDGATVTIDAPKGALPAGTTVKIVKMDTVPEVEGVSFTQAVAYDVTLWKDNAEVQPAVAVSVKLSNVPLDAAPEEMAVYHKADDGTVDEGTVQADKSADLSMSSFSPIIAGIVADEAEEPAEAGADESINMPEAATYGLERSNEITAAENRAGGTYSVSVGGTIQIVGRSNWKSYGHRWTVTQGDRNISMTSSGSAAWVTGQEAGTATLKHSWYTGFGNYHEESFTINVSEASGTKVIAYFYAARPDVDPSVTGNSSFFFVGTGTLDISGLSMKENEYVFDGVADRVVSGPNEEDVKNKIALIYGVEDADQVEISYSYYKIGYVYGAPDFNENDPQSSGKNDLANGALCYHVDMAVSVKTPEEASYYFYVKQPGETSYGQPVKTGMVAIGTQVEPPLQEEQQYNNVTYVFDGWYMDEACKIPATSFVINDISNFYGRYLPKYTVTYDDGVDETEAQNVTGMPEVNPQNAIGEKAYTVAGAPSRAGYDFAGWKLDANTTYQAGQSIQVTGNMTLTAQWNAIKKDGSITVKVQKQDIGQTTPQDVRDDNAYINVTGTMDGFLSESDSTTGDINVQYQYQNDSDATVTVSYIYNGTDKDQYILGIEVTPKDGNTQTVASGNTWECTGVLKSATITVTLYQKMTLTYNANGGNGNVESPYTTSVKNPTTTVAGQGELSKTGYSFTGWNTASDGKGTSYAANASITLTQSSTTLYAQWKIINYNITYEGVDETFTPNRRTYTVEEGFTLTDEPSKEGYTFTGWTWTVEGGTGSSTATKTPVIAKGTTGDIVFTANWTADPVSVNITYYLDDQKATGLDSTAYPSSVGNKKYDDPLTIQIGETGKDVNVRPTAAVTSGNTATDYIIEKIVYNNETVFELSKSNYENLVYTDSKTLNGNAEIQVYYASDTGYMKDGIPDKYQVVAVFHIDPAEAGTWQNHPSSGALYASDPKTIEVDGQWSTNSAASASVVAADVDTVVHSGGYTDSITWSVGDTNIETPVGYNMFIGGGTQGSNQYDFYARPAKATSTVTYTVENGTARVTSIPGNTWNGTTGTIEYQSSATIEFRANEGYVIDVSTIEAAVQQKPATNNEPCFTIEKDQTTGEVYAKFDVYMSVENLGDYIINLKAEPDENGDGIPNKYQIEVTFQVENGLWNDETSAAQEKTLTLLDEKGQWSENGTAVLVAPQAGDYPAEGYMEGNWKETLPATVDKTANGKVYTYQYQPDPSKTYLVTYNAEGSGTVSKNRESAQVLTMEGIEGSTATPASGYNFDGWYKGNTKISGDAVLTPETIAQYLNKTNGVFANTAFTARFVAVGNLSYTVRYLEDNTARELASPKTVGGQTLGASVTEYALDIAGYSLMSNANPQTITIGTGDNIITFYYRAVGAATEPTPTPTENPTPAAITPTTPTTPTTPAAPTTPAGPTVTAAPEEEVEAPAEEEEVPEEETPLAPEAGEEESIGEEETPLAGGNAAWALLNLILTILTALGSVLLLIGYLGKRRKEDEEGNEEYTVKKHGFWRLVSLIPGIGSIIVFILTEDMSLPMAFVDRWTLLMVIIAVIQIVIAVLSMKDKQEPDEDDAANA